MVKKEVGILGFLFLVLLLLAGMEQYQVKRNNKDAFAQMKTDDKKNESEQTLHLAVGKTGSLQKGGGEPIYRYPDETSEQIATLQFHCAVILNSHQDTEQWIHVDLVDTDGYVKADAVELYDLPVGDITDNPVRNTIVNDALTFIGLKFKRYGQSLETGIDCSNFVQQIYGRSGISIPRTPNKMRKTGSYVEEQDALPGDVVYYDANHGEGHVGLYLGNGYIINSAGHAGKIYPEGGVRICKLQYKDREVYEFRRFIKGSHYDGE